MNDIIKELEQKNLENTTNKKKWINKCSKCGKEKSYSRKYNLDRSIERGNLCGSCSKKGKLKSEEHKRKIGISHIGINHTKETKLKLSISHKGLISGEKNPWYGKNRSGKNNPNYGKTGNKSFWYGKSHTEETKKKISKSHIGIKPSAESKYKMRLSAIKRIKEKRIKPYTNYNPKACEYFDKLNKERGWNLQHALNGGEIEIYGYFLDSYDKNKNIIVEYDEPKHEKPSQKKKDEIRQQQIIEILNPAEFWRYSENHKKLTQIYSTPLTK